MYSIQHFTTKNAEETKKVAKELAGTLQGGESLILFGDLGSGKTTFAQGIAEALGITTQVTSPTFVIVKQHAVSSHSTIKKLIHADLYRVDDEQVVQEVGLKDALSNAENVTLIEWGERMGKSLPDKRIEVHFQYDGDARKIKIQHHGA